MLPAGAAGWLKSTLALPGVAVKYSGVLNGIGERARLGSHFLAEAGGRPCCRGSTAVHAPAPRLALTPAHPVLSSPPGFLSSPADTTFWDPAIDPHLPACYTPQQQEGKALCKRFLQQVRRCSRPPQIRTFSHMPTSPAHTISASTTAHATPRHATPCHT